MDRESYQGGGRRLTPEEKAERQRKLERKRRVRLAIVIVGFALVISIVVCPVVLFAAFRVKNFTVEGVSPYSKEEIIAASEIETGKSLIFADVDEAKAAIEKNLPYTADVVITKKLPGTIVIRYGETSKAFAVQLGGGTYALTDSKLKVLEIGASVPEGITLISGAVPVNAQAGTTVSFTENTEDEEETGDRKLEIILSVLSAIPEAESKNINLIDVSSNNNIYFIYKERVVMRFGDSTDIEPRIDLGFRSLAVEQGIDPSVTGIITSTIPKEASFNPQDVEDIKELVIYNGGEWEAPENPLVNGVTEEETEENDE